MCLCLGLGRCETETPATFVVETVDENGAQVTTGGAPVAVRIDGKDRDTAMGAVIDNVLFVCVCVCMCVCVCVYVCVSLSVPDSLFFSRIERWKL